MCAEQGNIVMIWVYIYIFKVNNVFCTLIKCFFWKCQLSLQDGCDSPISN